MSKGQGHVAWLTTDLVEVYLCRFTGKLDRDADGYCRTHQGKDCIATFRRADLPPEGMVERWAHEFPADGLGRQAWMIEGSEEKAKKAASALSDIGCRAIRIFVPEDTP